MSNEETVKSLQDALRVSPDNAPLRCHLARTLMSLGRLAEAEQHYNQVLQGGMGDAEVKTDLASCYFKQDKISHAIVVIEDMIKKNDITPRAHLLHARLLHSQGDVEGAVEAYKEAILLEPEQADTHFADQLGIRIGQDHDYDDEVVDGRLRAGHAGSDGDWQFEMQRPEIDFDHVGGMEKIKEEVQLKIIHPLTHPEIYAAYGKPIGGGILMYGPPGCGKTHLARATAGEVQANFIAIGIHDVLDMWIGQSERNLHELFETARANRPCVLFFDEVDALGASRTDLKHSAGRQIINQFLSELDGVSASNDGVLILAATNAPWHLDAAFRRPGRFDRVLFIPPPDLEARASILNILLRDKPTDNVDHVAVAKKTDGLSGADLKAVVDTAIESKLKRAIKEGVPSPLSTKDLLHSSKSVKPSSKEWFSTARNYAMYSNQGGAYDDILKYLKIKK